MFLVLLFLPHLSLAGECDGKALREQLDEANPVAVGGLFTKLADCDSEEATGAAPVAIPRMLAGPEGFTAASRAVELGLPELVHSWIESLEPDQRSRAVAAIGERCAESEPVQSFFLETHSERGIDFFTQRWHRGLIDCRVEPVQALLAQAINSKELAKDRPKLFNVLEVYARNLRGKAIPGLVALAEGTSDAEELTYLINAFADTAGVGSVEGLDRAVAGEAAQAVVGLGPKLPPRAVEQARTTLTALGASDEADQLAVHRWRERKDDQGNYRYAVAVTESYTCKNGKKFVNLHLGAFAEAGVAWPEQLVDDLQDKLTYEWSLDGATRCKGSGDISVEMVEEPFESVEDQTAWIEKRAASLAKIAEGADRSKVLRHEPFVY